MTAVHAVGLDVHFGTHQVLRSVDLWARPGEVLGIVGPNGAGKTTLLRALAGLQPCQGSISYGDIALAKIPARQRAKQRTYVGQNQVTQLPYRVDEVVAMGLAHQDPLFRAPKALEAVRAALAQVACSVAPERRFDALSGGERQQVVLARAFIQNACVMLLDEPVSALDVRHQVAVLRALRRRAERGATVLVSLHDLNLAALLCDRLALLRAGEIYAVGDVQAVLTAERLRAVYGVDLLVHRHPARPVPQVALDFDAAAPF